MAICLWKDRKGKLIEMEISDNYAALTRENYIKYFSKEAGNLYLSLCDFFEQYYKDSVDSLVSINKYSVARIADDLNLYNGRTHWTEDLSYMGII